MSIARTGPSRPPRGPRMAVIPVAVLAVVSALVIAACGGTTSADVAARAPTTEPAAQRAAGDAAGDEAATDDTAEPSADGAATTTMADDGRDPVLGANKPVTIAFAGDMNFEGPTGSRLAADPSTVFGPVAGILSDADFTIANLETAVTKGGGSPVGKQFTFSTGPEALTAIAAAGIDVVSMANNHGMDYGESGFADSLQVKQETDLPIIGMGANEDEAYAPHIAEVNGQRIGVIAATQVLDGSFIESWTATSDHAGLASAKRVDKMIETVTATRPKVDTLIVFLHWGTETETCPNEAQTQLTPQLIAAGADMVVGGHQHRVLSAGYSGAAFVGYGLGNFLFQANSELGSRSGVLKVTATGRRIDGYEWLPARINGANQPIPAEGQEAQNLLANWNELRGCTGLTETATAQPTAAG